MVGGYSKSNISGDKSENSQGDFDYWIVKLNSNGVIVWENTIGGSGIDYPRDVIQLADGTYMIAGWSNSNVSGDKTIASNGGYDHWLVKLNSGGTIIAQNSIGGSGDESGTYIHALPGGDFVMGCSTDSNISGDKGDNSEGLDDYWVFRTGPEILGIETNEFGPSLKAYPNPTHGRITVELGEFFSEVQLTVLNILGQVVHTSIYENTDQIDFDLKTNAGMYLFKITTPNGKKCNNKGVEKLR